jgi:aminoglycoside phosphotransferase (APT) family kinase protein
VVDLSRPDVGWSCETLIVTLDTATGGERVVLRLPPVGDAIFPAYDLELQGAAQELAGAHGVPTASPVQFEPDPSWLGTPFLTMPFVTGRVPADFVPGDRWIATLGHDGQSALWSSVLATVAAICRTPWNAAPLSGRLRGGRGGLGEELAWWHSYLEWLSDGSPPPTLRDALAWCHSNAPAEEPPPSLLWGDVRLGNVIFDDRTLQPRAVLDWDMVSVGPAEMDLAWLLALDSIPEELGAPRVVGFPDHDTSVREFQQHLGRPVRDLAWYEIFALVRSTAILARIAVLFRVTERQSRSAIDVRPLLEIIDRHIDAFGRRDA